MRPDVTPLERVLWACLLVVNAATHLAALGARGVSHDESLHAYYSYELATYGRYQHDPMMHGPFLFHVTATAFRLLGDSETTARLPQALAGIALVPALFLYRRVLGRRAAFLAAVLASTSPSLLFYGRYARNDVFMALFALFWVYGLLRYLDSRDVRFLLLVSAAQSLSFCAKETAFLTGLSLGAFCAALACVRVARGRERLRDSPAAHLALVMATNVLPFLTALVHRVAGWDPADFDSPVARWRAAGLVPLALLVAGALARAFCRGDGLPFRRWLLATAAFWVAPLALFTTFFTNASRGLTSGVVGSLGYWLGQHGVARGGQPWFYYGLLAVLYEPLTVAVAAAAAVALALRAGRGRACGAAPALLAWWTVSSAAAYSVAGEKMPWLLVHVALPACLLTARVLARVYEGVRPRLATAAGCVLLAAPLALAAALLPLAWLPATEGRGLEAAVAATRVQTQAALALAVVAATVWALRRLRLRDGLRVAGLGAAAALALFTARVAFRASFVLYDRADELLVYAHGTPDLARTMRTIDEVARRSGEGRALAIAYDDDSAWPMTWYLRRRPQQRYLGNAELSGPRLLAPVVIVGAKNLPSVEGRLSADYVRRDYRLVWWPVEDYDAPAAELLAALLDPVRRRRIARYLLTHETGYGSADWPLRHDFALFVRRDLAAPAATPGPGGAAAPPAARGPFVETFALAPRAVWSGTYDGRPFARPAAVAVGPDGLRYVADTGNDRVVVLDADGAFVRAFGRRCALARGGCADPDGAGPLRAGDGGLASPEGVAVAADGTVLVADTGNGRIALFDGRGRFLRNWSRLPAGDGSPRLLDDPRGVAVEPTGGRVAVADTGNDRVLLFTRDGRLERETFGSADDRLAGPVGVAFGAGGSLYVADPGHRRLLRVDDHGTVEASWDAGGWSASDRPYVAALSSGAVYASDPSHARVLAYAVTGDLAGALAVAGDGAFAPAGLALDERRGELVVADPGANRIVVLPVGGAR